MDAAGLKAMIADRVVSAQRVTTASAAAAAGSRVMNASIAEGAEPKFDPAQVMKEFFAKNMG